MMCGLEDAGFVVRDCFAWLFGSGFPKNFNLGDGKGTALKPAHEPIAIAWKPFKGSIKACHETRGTAALNIDACRVGYQSDADYESAKGGDSGSAHKQEQVYGGGWGAKPQSEKITPLGRWPANVVLDEEAAAELDAQTGELKSGGRSHEPGDDAGGRWRESEGRTDPRLRASSYERAKDLGGASRFYYVAKPSREERDMGCHNLPARQRDESRKEGNPGGDNPRNRGLQPRGNFHPTVKPVELMRWLVRLVTPINGIVLDPFMGSGTTGMACAYEQRQFVGIEREADYVAIAERRIASVAPLFQQDVGSSRSTWEGEA